MNVKISHKILLTKILFFGIIKESKMVKERKIILWELV